MWRAREGVRDMKRIFGMKKYFYLAFVILAAALLCLPALRSAARADSAPVDILVDSCDSGADFNIDYRYTDSYIEGANALRTYTSLDANLFSTYADPVDVSAIPYGSAYLSFYYYVQISYIYGALNIALTLSGGSQLSWSVIPAANGWQNFKLQIQAGIGAGAGTAQAYAGGISGVSFEQKFGGASGNLTTEQSFFAVDDISVSTNPALESFLVKTNTTQAIYVESPNIIAPGRIRNYNWVAVLGFCLAGAAILAVAAVIIVKIILKKKKVA